MPYTPALSYYLGPLAVYTSPSGMIDVQTQVPYLGGTLHEGDYVDATKSEISQWNIQFGAQLDTGRYRLVRVSPTSVAANFGYGFPVGWGKPSYVGLVAVSAPGTGSGSGSVLCSSTTSGGTAATALVNIAAGVITGAQLVYAGANFTSTPTFGLTEITAAGITTSGTIVAQMLLSPNIIGSFDTTGSIDITSVRGICLTTLTAAQITAGAYIVIQELGIAPIYVTTASGTPAPGNGLTSATAAVVTSNSTITNTSGFIGYALDLPSATTLIRGELSLPVRQG